MLSELLVAELSDEVGNFKYAERYIRNFTNA